MRKFFDKITHLLDQALTKMLVRGHYGNNNSMFDSGHNEITDEQMETKFNNVVRCREHLGVNKKGISIKGASSSIRDHINETGHAASFDDFCILDKANNNFYLLIHESLLILRDRPTLNQQNSSIPLHLF